MKGANLAAMIEDALLRVGLSLIKLRGMAIDRASNMAGAFKGNFTFGKYVFF